MAICHRQKKNVKDFFSVGNDLIFLDAVLLKVAVRNQQETHLRVTE